MASQPDGAETEEKDVRKTQPKTSQDIQETLREKRREKKPRETLMPGDTVREKPREMLMSRETVREKPNQTVRENTKRSKDDAFLLEMPEAQSDQHTKRESKGNLTVGSHQSKAEVAGDSPARPNQPKEAEAAPKQSAAESRADDSTGAKAKSEQFMFFSESTKTKNPERPRRKLELPSGLEPEFEKNFSLRPLETESTGIGARSSRSSYQDPEPKSPLRLRLTNMQSKWLRDTQPKGKFKLAVADDSELQRLRGTNGWLFHLMKEAGTEEFLPPPWLPKPGSQPAKQADELPTAFKR